MGRRFLDTCSLLELVNLSDINTADICLSSVTLQELENIKTSANKDSETKYRARVAVRALKDNPNVEIIVVNRDDYQYLEDKELEITNDNLIIASAYRYSQEHNITFYTEDLLCGFIAKNYFGLEVQSVKTDDKSDMYKGYKVIHGNTDVINKYMDNINFDDWSVNEYLIIENTDDDTSKEMRFDGEKFVNLKLPPSKFIKGKNSLQRCALDILMNPEITVAAVLGGYGSGKTFLAMQMALYNVQEKGNQSKILGVRETLGEGQSIGYLPGTKDEKVGNFFAPLVQSLNGGEFELEKLKMSGVLEVNVPYYMKGTTYNNTVIICDEAEDLSESQIRLIGTRLGENSKIYFAGDYKQSIVNKSQNNPLVKMCNEFKGKHNFACIYLGEDVRSETSKMFAELFEI
jgi:PhoH-like ATPase